jgi:hypothetical protein
MRVDLRMNHPRARMGWVRVCLRPATRLRGANPRAILLKTTAAWKVRCCPVTA